MKNYSIGTRDRVFAILMIALIAFIVTNIPLLFSWLNIVLGLFGDRAGLRFPSVESELAWYGVNVFSLPLFAVLFWAFNNYLWRWMSPWIGIPDLNGQWFGALNRQHLHDDTIENSIPITANIRQTFMRMSFKLSGKALQSTVGDTLSEVLSVSLDGDSETGYIFNHMYRVLPAKSYGACALNLVIKSSKYTLEGEYTSSAMRTGKIKLTRLSGEEELITGVIRKLTGASGNNYLAVQISHALVSKWKKKLGLRVDHQTFSKLLENRKMRDGDMHHMTIVRPDEFSTLPEVATNSLIGTEVQFTIIGLGKQERDECKAYFVVAMSSHANLLRSQLELANQDFHITLGFDPQDLHDCAKDESTIFV